MPRARPGDPIRWRIHLPIPPERVYAALDSDEGRASFWADSAVERDGVIHFRFINGQTCAATIVTRRPPHEWTIEYFGAAVRIDLAGDGAGGTDLTLTQTGVPPHEWHEVHAGWLNVLLPFKAWLVHGVDLRNHDAARTWDEGYADQ